jgi:hypothetical protein
LNGYEAHLVFEPFSLTLEDALDKKIIKEELRAKFAKQSLAILESFQKSKKMLKDIRPGIFGLTDRVKLIDFGMYF